MSFLYVTADSVNAETGGGKVTHHESKALKSLGPCEVLGREELEEWYCGDVPDPWHWDAKAALATLTKPCRLAHFYAGTFGRTVQLLKVRGVKVCYTVAAHDREVSRREHGALGIPFPYHHLVDEYLWQRYIDGYRNADVIVCPSTVAERTVRGYGPDFAKKDIRVIPHGCNLPDTVKPPPSRFTVGYMGSYGADKGVRYLLEAWKRLDYADAVLVLAGRDSTSPWVRSLIERYGGGNIQLRGWVDDPGDFYNSLSLYCQPSATEGFGMEVLEAMAHGRPVVCSKGAGAADCVPMLGNVFSACDPDLMASQIEWVRNDPHARESEQYREEAIERTWDKVQAQYIALWKEMQG